jgi:hypothetical protein
LAAIVGGDADLNHVITFATHDNSSPRPREENAGPNTPPSMKSDGSRDGPFSSTSVFLPALPAAMQRRPRPLRCRQRLRRTLYLPRATPRWSRNGCRTNRVPEILILVSALTVRFSSSASTAAELRDSSAAKSPQTFPTFNAKHFRLRAPPKPGSLTRRSYSFGEQASVKPLTSPEAVL